MNRSTVTAGLMVGAAVGLLVGAAYARARRAWSDYKTTKASVPILRKTAWILSGLAAAKGGVLVLLVALAVFWAASVSTD